MAQKGIPTKADPLTMEDFTLLVNGLHADKKYRWESSADWRSVAHTGVPMYKHLEGRNIEHQ